MGLAREHLHDCAGTGLLGSSSRAVRFSHVRVRVKLNLGKDEVYFCFDVIPPRAGCLKPIQERRLHMLKVYLFCYICGYPNRYLFITKLQKRRHNSDVPKGVYPIQSNPIQSKTVPPLLNKSAAANPAKTKQNNTIYFTSSSPAKPPHRSAS